MTASLFDSCGDSCGWVAAVVAAICYGSYGVPIKETVSFDVHPLMFQSYKTFTMFLTCWFVLTMGVTVAFTPWGILSGLLWCKSFGAASSCTESSSTHTIVAFVTLHC